MVLLFIRCFWNKIGLGGGGGIVLLFLCFPNVLIRLSMIKMVAMNRIASLEVVGMIQ